MFSGSCFEDFLSSESLCQLRMPRAELSFRNYRNLLSLHRGQRKHETIRLHYKWLNGHKGGTRASGADKTSLSSSLSVCFRHAPVFPTIQGYRIHKITQEIRTTLCMHRMSLCASSPGRKHVKTVVWFTDGRFSFGRHKDSRGTSGYTPWTLTTGWT